MPQHSLDRVERPYAPEKLEPKRDVDAGDFLRLGGRGMASFFTVGHGARSLDELLRALHSACIERVVDVRRFPGSRRHPHFAREALEAALPPAGIAYEWWGEQLGGRRSSRREKASRHPAWRNTAFRSYADYMDTEHFRDALEKLTSTDDRRRTALMCAETLWWNCHRRLISDALTLAGHDVIHVIDAGKTQRHELHEAARRDDDGYPVYDVGTTGPLPL